MQREHKVGTVTLGITLIIIGILFLLQLFGTGIPFLLVMKVWPIAFILLGIEVLLVNRNVNKQEFIYDKIGIALTVGLLGFAMFLALISNTMHFCI